MSNTQYKKLFQIGFILISILMFTILVTNYYLNITKYDNIIDKKVNFNEKNISKYKVSISNAEFLFFNKQQQTFLVNIKLINQFNSVVELCCITGDVTFQDIKSSKFFTDKLVLKFKKKSYCSKVTSL